MRVQRATKLIPLVTLQTNRTSNERHRYLSAEMPVIPATSTLGVSLGSPPGCTRVQIL